LQLRHGLLFVFFHGGAGLLHLLLGPGTGLLHGLRAQLGSLLAAGFLILEDFLAGFADALLVLGRAGFGNGDIGSCFFHRALGAAAALGEHGGERAMDDERIEDVKRRQKKDGGNGSEQYSPSCRSVCSMG